MRLLSHPLAQVSRAVRSTVVGAILLAPISTELAQADTIVERRLAALQPCAGLEAEDFGLRLAIDKLESVELSHVELDLSGDVITVSMQGALACRTSDAAVIQGNASVAVDAEAQMDLADCSEVSLSISPTEFGGTFAPAVRAAWQPIILPKLMAETKKMLTQACNDLVPEP